MSENTARLIHPAHPGDVKEVDALKDHEELVRLMVAGWRQEPATPATAETEEN